MALVLAPNLLKMLLEEPSARPAKRLNSWRARALRVVHVHVTWHPTWSTVAGTRAPHSHSLAAELAVHAQEWPQPVGAPVIDVAVAAAAARLNSGNTRRQRGPTAAAGTHGGEKDQHHRHTLVSMTKPTIAAVRMRSIAMVLSLQKSSSACNTAAFVAFVEATLESTPGLFPTPTDSDRDLHAQVRKRNRLLAV
jgi:hypothetical protein